MERSMLAEEIGLRTTRIWMLLALLYEVVEANHRQTEGYFSLRLINDLEHRTVKEVGQVLRNTMLPADERDRQVLQAYDNLAAIIESEIERLS